MRRISVTLVLAAGLTATSFASGTVADACSNSSHCYGVAEWAPTPSGHGAHEYVYAYCLSTPSASSNFVTAELWVGTNNSTTLAYWIEQGLAYGYPQGSRRYWFWADNRPTYGYYEHDRTDLSANLNQGYWDSIYYNGSNQWSVKRDSSVIGTSTSNPPNSKSLETGTEMTSGSAVVFGQAYSMAWEDTGNAWHGDWSSSGYANPKLISNSPASAAWVAAYNFLDYGANDTGC